LCCARGIEGLIGSRFDDTLTGNALNNVLAGGLGNDTLDGKGGIDRVDYSRDHFFDVGDTADQVVVRLGINGASGTGAEFKAFANPFGPPFIVQVSTDTLISIENVTGSAGPDTIVGNELSNTLEGRGGNDNLDGGFGDDTLIGGAGIDTASFLSHDTALVLAGEQIKISLGLNGADGHATRTGFDKLGQFQTESDVLQGIENVTGSNHSETLNGNEQNNILDGRGGNDILDGGLGNDTLTGGAGNDALKGGGR
jgi:Ca2+-binding RTX toxin-like protein